MALGSVMLSSMAEPLEGCYIRLERAKQHRDELNRELRPLLEGPSLKSILIEAPYDPKTQQFRPKVAHAPTIPPRLSAIASDCIQNLRIALEYRAYQVTGLHSNGPFDGSTFPIVNKLTNLNSGKAAETLKFFTADQRAIVERHQVYDAADDYRTLGLAQNLSDINLRFRLPNAPLRDLRNFSNRDKHKLLLRRYLVAEEPILTLRPIKDCAPTVSMQWAPVVLEPGAKLWPFWANPTGPDPEMHVDFEFGKPPLIAIGEGGGEGGEVLSALDGMAAKVLRILREFEPFFQ